MMKMVYVFYLLRRSEKTLGPLVYLLWAKRKMTIFHQNFSLHSFHCHETISEIKAKENGL